MVNIHSSIKVSVAHHKSVKIQLSNAFFYGETQKRIDGIWDVYIEGGELFLESDEEIIAANTYAVLTPILPSNCTFTILSGSSVSNHSSYKGCAELHVLEDQVVVINEITIENYIQSLLCHNYPHNNCLEFLKLEAIILRNTLINLERKMNAMFKSASEVQVVVFYTELLKNKKALPFFEYKAPELIGLYKGLAKKCNLVAHQAVEESTGIVVLYNDEICEMPQSVCCGGVTEGEFTPLFLEQELHLQRICDSELTTTLDLTQNDNMDRWIDYPIKCYCDEDNPDAIKALSSGEQELPHELFRWQTIINNEALTVLLKDEMQINIGVITDVKVLKRGSSGAVSCLRLEGTKSAIELKGQFIVQLKEVLNIQSLAFIINKTDNQKGFNFEIMGSGRGFGAGLCQMGALRQAQMGKSAEEILSHYFPQVYLEKYY